MRILRWAAAIAFVASSRVLSQGREIARTTADLNGDGRPDVISIRSLSPRSVSDRQPWCGAGRKDTGRVDISVTLSGGMYRKTNVNSLLHEPSLSFSAKSWSVVLADYNGDGRPDFNLGQYAGCNGWAYAIFTVRDDGSVSRLKVNGGLVRVTDDANSTRKITPIRGGFAAEWYDNSRGNVRAVYCWNAPANRFDLRKEVVGDSIGIGTKPPVALGATGCLNKL